MPITHSGVIPISLIRIAGRVIAFPQGEMTLDIPEGKLFLRFDLRERPSANQEIVHAQDQSSAPLRFELGLGQRAIARACSISQSTVHEYLKKAEAAKVPGPLPGSIIRINELYCNVMQFCTTM